MQCQLWTETVRTQEQMENLLWPRILAVAERAWHEASWESVIDENERAAQIKSDWTDFARVLSYVHLPILDTMGIKYSIRPPGIR